ncbi:MAG: SpoIIE family protein phosphatase, partial [Candidatus Eisenbacteria bacterium]
IERIGHGDLATPIEMRDRTEFGMLATAVNEMAAGLGRAQSELIERERLAHEVELARQIQQSLLPADPVTAGPFRLRGDHQAAAEVGGDYYDILPLSDGRVGLAIADVAGKGLAGCLVMSMLSALLRALRNDYTSPAALLSVLDERLSETLRPGVFATMCYGILDPASGRFTFASAGHNPMILYRRDQGRTEVFQSKGVPLAALRGGAGRPTLGDEVMTLRPGDVLVQFTDGFSEAFDPTHREQFGLARLERVVGDIASRGADAVGAGLKASVGRWSGGTGAADDQTLLILARSPDAATPVVDAASAPSAETAEALARLAEAERLGQGLRLAASIHSLGAMRSWLSHTPLLRELDGEHAQLLGSALYEVCANVAEHGFREDGTREFDLWWIAPPVGDRRRESAEALVRRGMFVIRDDGIPFRPGSWSGLDLDNPGIRRRGRGLGLEIIHRVMSQVAYHPGTSRGNITLLTFGPRPAPTAPAVQEGQRT